MYYVILFYQLIESLFVKIKRVWNNNFMLNKIKIKIHKIFWYTRFSWIQNAQKLNISSLHLPGILHREILWTFTTIRSLWAKHYLNFYLRLLVFHCLYFSVTYAVQIYEEISYDLLL